MNLLAIDTSTEAGSVALTVNEQIFSDFELCPQSHSVLILPMVDKLIKQADCTLSQFDGLVFGRGPGSFTGVRIGIGVAQGLAYSAELPVYGVSTLQAMAQQAYRLHNKKRVLAAIDARMAEIYVGLFECDDAGVMQPLSPEVNIKPEDIAALIEQHNGEFYGVGTGFETYQTLLQSFVSNTTFDVLYPNALDMLTLAKTPMENGEGVDAENAQPVYVRDTISWKKLPGRE
ncbi:tRNA (adenosine(37)-N6)-threonylcarbamoyltransferase complex dimerization subunit type 1 TsaB [Thalassotalea agarivorans]|uniref:tRNA (adenosine(37)-N6)-threonylcarbamoyltransferase complex dimerization subunit type 1 TsaB n=1 Tax=Thalassotalea agarivorans TaxID=349064 RepID=UPI000A43A1AE|nr:tRNA (adenosine(37)-N6)-threonylcarbamoyltransferase complex dimerization subunit type 1 TsaB [Thalassotalea agarivorans]